MSRALLRGAHRVIKYLMRFDILSSESITGVMNGGAGGIRTPPPFLPAHFVARCLARFY